MFTNHDLSRKPNQPVERHQSVCTNGKVRTCSENTETSIDKIAKGKPIPEDLPILVKPIFLLVKPYVQ